MNMNDALQLAQTVMIVLGGGLALWQLRQSEQNRNRDAALQMLRSFQTAEFSRGMETMFNLPDGLDKQELEAQVGARMGDLYVVLTTLESMGVLVYRREIPIDMVDDFFSGPIVLTWRKCGPYIQALRRETGRETIAEWVQWLAERFGDMEREQEPAPAYIAHRDWRRARR